MLNQRGKDWFVHRCELDQARVQTLQFAFRHRVEVDTPNTLLDARTLQPTKEDLSGTGIRDRARANHVRSLRQKGGSLLLRVARAP